MCARVRVCVTCEDVKCACVSMCVHMTEHALCTCALMDVAYMCLR